MTDQREAWPRPYSDGAAFKDVTPANDDQLIRLHELLSHETHCNLSIAAICQDQTMAEKLIFWIDGTPLLDEKKLNRIDTDWNELKNIYLDTYPIVADAVESFQLFVRAERLVSQLRGEDRGSDWEEKVKKGDLYPDVVNVLDLIDRSEDKDSGATEGERTVSSAFLAHLKLTNNQVAILTNYESAYRIRELPYTSNSYRRFIAKGGVEHCARVDYLKETINTAQDSLNDAPRMFNVVFIEKTEQPKEWIPQPDYHR